MGLTVVVPSHGGLAGDACLHHYSCSLASQMMSLSPYPQIPLKCVASKAFDPTGCSHLTQSQRHIQVAQFTSTFSAAKKHYLAVVSPLQYTIHPEKPSRKLGRASIKLDGLTQVCTAWRSPKSGNDG